VELNCSVIRPLIDVAVRQRFPDNSEYWLSNNPEYPNAEAPIKRYEYSYFKDKTEKRHPSLIGLIEGNTIQATAKATQIGICIKESSGTLLRPSRQGTIYGDGTVIKPRCSKMVGTKRKDNKTGKLVPVNAEIDAKLHTEGGGHVQLGMKLNFMAARNPQENERIILSVMPANNDNEADVAVEQFKRIKELLPDAKAALYDGALHGVHLRELYQTGLVPTSRMRRANGKKAPQRTLGTREVRNPDGTTTNLHMHLLWGLPNVMTEDINAKRILEPCEIIDRTMAKRSNGYRWYNVYKVPNESGGGTFRERLDQTDDDRAKKGKDNKPKIPFNREEHLRAIPPVDPYHDGYFSLRSDAESGNAKYDNSMVNQRSHSVGMVGTLWDALMWQIYQNAIAVELHRRRKAAVERRAA